MHAFESSAIQTFPEKILGVKRHSIKSQMLQKSAIKLIYIHVAKKKLLLEVSNIPDSH